MVCVNLIPPHTIKGTLTNDEKTNNGVSLLLFIIIE